MRPTMTITESGSRVLVVEDNSTNQLVARRMLEIGGFQVETVTNGRDASMLPEPGRLISS